MLFKMAFTTCSSFIYTAHRAVRFGSLVAVAQRRSGHLQVGRRIL